MFCWKLVNIFLFENSFNLLFPFFRKFIIRCFLLFGLSLFRIFWHKLNLRILRRIVFHDFFQWGEIMKLLFQTFRGVLMMDKIFVIWIFSRSYLQGNRGPEPRIRNSGGSCPRLRNGSSFPRFSWEWVGIRSWKHHDRSCRKHFLSCGRCYRYICHVYGRGSHQRITNQRNSSFFKLT